MPPLRLSFQKQTWTLAMGLPAIKMLTLPPESTTRKFHVRPASKTSASSSTWLSRIHSLPSTFSQTHETFLAFVSTNSDSSGFDAIGGRCDTSGGVLCDSELEVEDIDGHEGSSHDSTWCFLVISALCIRVVYRVI